MSEANFDAPTFFQEIHLCRWIIFIRKNMRLILPTAGDKGVAKHFVEVRRDNVPSSIASLASKNGFNFLLDG